MRLSAMLTKGTQPWHAILITIITTISHLQLLLRIPRPTHTADRSDIPCRSNTPDIFCAGLLGPWLDVQ